MAKHCSNSHKFILNSSVNYWKSVWNKDIQNIPEMQIINVWLTDWRCWVFILYSYFTGQKKEKLDVIECIITQLFNQADDAQIGDLCWLLLRCSPRAFCRRGQTTLRMSNCQTLRDRHPPLRWRWLEQPGWSGPRSPPSSLPLPRWCLGCWRGRRSVNWCNTERLLHLDL